WCAGVRRTGRISISVTSWPRCASCHAASQPARPPPTTVTSAMTIRSSCASRALRRRHRLGRELAVALGAAVEGASGLRRLLDEERRLAVGARHGDGPVPRGPVAVRVPRAAPERLTPPRPLLSHVPLAAARALESRDRARPGVAAFRVIGARDEGTHTALALHQLAAALGALLPDRTRLLLLLAIERLRVAAFRVAGAAEEAAVAAPAHHERPAALRALRALRGDDIAQHLVAPLLTLRERLLERAVELAQHLAPVQLALLDAVQLALHLAGEAHVEELREQPHQELRHRLAQRRRVEALLLQLHVLPVHQRGDDLRVR